jgi:hypothetical protein
MPGLNLSGIAAMVEDLILLDIVRFSTPAAGQPVFDTATGRYTYPEGDVLYEGKGAVQSGALPESAAAMVGSLPWVNETMSKYRAFTPLSAPLAVRDTIVTVVGVHTGGDVSLIGRQWRVQDPSQAGTLGVIRVTSLDQIQQNGQAAI